jgi:hypothetical protein
MQADLADLKQGIQNEQNILKLNNAAEYKK